MFTFRKEHKPIPESDIVLGGINLKARLAGAIVRTSIELLEDSPIANDLIQQVLTNAMAQKLDWALLAGDGSQTGDLDNPTGLLNWPGVPAVTDTAPITNYDKFVDAYGSVLAANGVPNAMIAGTGVAVGAMKTKTGITGDNTILTPPGAIADLGQLLFDYRPAFGPLAGKAVTYTREDLLWLKDRSETGLLGTRRLQRAGQAMACAVSIQSSAPDRDGLAGRARRRRHQPTEHQRAGRCRRPGAS